MKKVADLKNVFSHQLFIGSRSIPYIIFSLTQPVFWLIIFTQLFDVSGYLNTNQSPIQFLTPGILIMTSFYGSSFMGMGLIVEKKEGIIDRHLSSPIDPSVILLGRVFANCVYLLFQAMVIFLIAKCLGFSACSNAGIFISVIVIIFQGIMIGSLSILLASVVQNQDAFFALVNFFTLPAIFLSGLISPLENSSGWIVILSKFNPLTYGVKLVHTFLLKQPYEWTQARTVSLVFILLTLVFITTAVFTFRKTAYSD